MLTPTGYNASGYARHAGEGHAGRHRHRHCGGRRVAARASPTVMSFATPASESGLVVSGAPVTGQAAGLGSAEAMARTGASPWSLFSVAPETSPATGAAYLAHGLATASVAGAVTSFGPAGYDLHKSPSAPVAWVGVTLAS